MPAVRERRVHLQTRRQKIRVGTGCNRTRFLYSIFLFFYKAGNLGPWPTALPAGIQNWRGACRRRAPLKINRPRPGAAEKLFANSKLLQSRTVESWISCGSATETQNRQPSPQNGSRAVIFGAISPFRDKWKLLQKHFEFLTNQSLRMALAKTGHERGFLRGVPGRSDKTAFQGNGQIVHPGP